MYVIYKLTSPDNQCYIGYTSDFNKRLAEHKRDSKYDLERDLYMKMNEYTADDFKTEIIDTAETKDEAQEKEIYYITLHDSYRNGLNMTPGGDGRDSQSMSEQMYDYWNGENGEENKRKQSERMKGNKLSSDREPWNKNRSLPEEHKQKIALGLKSSRQRRQKSQKENWSNGKYDDVDWSAMIKKQWAEGKRQAQTGWTQTDHQKKKAAEANQKTWLVETPEGKQIKVTNLRQFARENNLDQGNLVRTLKQTTTKQHKGYKVLQQYK